MNSECVKCFYFLIYEVEVVLLWEKKQYALVVEATEMDKNKEKMHFSDHPTISTAK